MTTKQVFAALWQPIKRIISYSSSAESNELAILKERDAKPSHYLLKIESFNELSKSMFSPCMTKQFTAGGYTWNFRIFPNGDEENDGKNHISLDLEVEDTDDLPVGWEVNATFNFFIYDQFRNKYVCLQDARKRCFNSIQSRWGVPKFIDLKTFNNSSKGYIVNENCIFGVEVFIACTEDLLTLIREPERTGKSYKWKFDNFSRKISDKWYKSDFFFSGDYKWRLLLNPNCYALSKDSITVGLEMDASSLPPNTVLVVNFVIRLVDQKEQNEYTEIKGTSNFPSARYTDPSNYGDCILEQEIDFIREPNFISLAELQDPKMGYLVNDSCIIEAEIDVLALHSLDNRI